MDIVVFSGSFKSFSSFLVQKIFGFLVGLRKKSKIKSSMLKNDCLLSTANIMFETYCELRKALAFNS